MNRGRCDDHQRPAFDGRSSSSDRYGQSGSARAALHRSILERDKRVCYWCGKPGANVVDHVVEVADGGALDDPSNLAAMHQEPCHRVKTAAAAAARRRRAGGARGAAAAVVDADADAVPRRKRAVPPV